MDGGKNNYEALLDFVARYRFHEVNRAELREAGIDCSLFWVEDIIPKNVIWLIEGRVGMDICKEDERVLKDEIHRRMAARFHNPSGFTPEIKTCTRVFQRVGEGNCVSIPRYVEEGLRMGRGHDVEPPAQKRQDRMTHGIKIARVKLRKV